MIVGEKYQHLGMLHSPERDWVEDFKHENGQYMNRCYKCKLTFIGYRGRFVCRQCFPRPPEEVTKTEANPPEVSDESNVQRDSGDE
jgi:hypothetical protein